MVFIEVAHIHQDRQSPLDLSIEDFAGVFRRQVRVLQVTGIRIKRGAFGIWLFRRFGVRSDPSKVLVSLQLSN